MRLPLKLITAATVLAGVIAWKMLAAEVRTRPETRAAAVKSAAGVARGKPGALAARIQQFTEEGLPKLPTPEQIRRHVESQNHSTASLLAAWRLGGDEAWLLEAAAASPEDPFVATAMIIQHGSGPGSAPWIESLKRNDPDNALGYLQAAKIAMDDHNPEKALSELAALEGISRMDLHFEEWRTAMTDAYTSAGHPGQEAEWAGLLQVPLASNGFALLGKSLGAAMTAAVDRGDRALAARLGNLDMKAATVARDDGGLLLSQLISVSMERSILNQMHGPDLVPGGDKLVLERLAEMDRRIDGIYQLLRPMTELLPTLTDAEMVQYMRRMRVEGELKAMQWLVAQRPAR